MMWFFFFQAEDGIRDVAVTGVQTCALPISRDEPEAMRFGGADLMGGEDQMRGRLHAHQARQGHESNGRKAAELDFRLAELGGFRRSEEHTSELQSRLHLVCRLLLEKTTQSQAPVPRRGATDGRRGPEQARPPRARARVRAGAGAMRFSEQKTPNGHLCGEAASALQT